MGKGVRAGVGSALDGAVPEGAAEVLVPAEREVTRHRILAAGVQVLRDVGYGDFSVQKVARAAGVYQGNVTYYWPRRRDLVEALAVFAIEDYRASVFAGYAQLDVAAPGWAGTLVAQVMQEAVREDKVRLLPELWSVGNAFPAVAAALGALYEEAVELMIATLGLDGDHPAVAPLRRELYLLGLAAEGLTAWFGNRRTDDPLLVMLQQEVIARFAPVIEELHAAAVVAAGPDRVGGVASVQSRRRPSGSDRPSLEA
jgi:AcrR family transcriptional regulator